MSKKISNKPTNQPTKPDVKSQASGFKYESWANDKVERIKESDATDTQLYDEYANKDPVRYTKVMSGRYDGNPMPKDYPRYIYNPSTGNYTDHHSKDFGTTPKSVEPKFFQNKLKNIQNSPKMSATRSWQIIKQTMSDEEREEHYQRHPEDRPAKITPVKLDEGLTQMLGDTWELESIFGKK